MTSRSRIVQARAIKVSKSLCTSLAGLNILQKGRVMFFFPDTRPISNQQIYIVMILNVINSISGRILNVSSVAGLYGYPGLSTYCTTKHAIEAMSSVLRHELAKFNISVISVQPGDFSKATHLLDNHHRNMNEMWSEMSDYQRDEYKDYFIAYHNGVARTGITGKRVKPLSVLPQNVIKGFERAMLTRDPDEHYLLLPTWHSQLKMTLLSFLPQKWGQKWAAYKYRKALPKVAITGQKMAKSPRIWPKNSKLCQQHGSFRSTTSSNTLSSVMSSTTF